MKEAPATSADAILATLSTVYQESIDNDSEQVAVEEELPKEDVAEATENEGGDSECNRQSTSRQKVTKDKTHPLIGKDL